MVGGCGTKVYKGIARSKINLPNVCFKMSSLHLFNCTESLESPKSLSSPLRGVGVADFDFYEAFFGLTGRADIPKAIES
jgi:hypothetical protein